MWLLSGPSSLSTGIWGAGSRQRQASTAGAQSSLPQQQPQVSHQPQIPPPAAATPHPFPIAAAFQAHAFPSTSFSGTHRLRGAGDNLRPRSRDFFSEVGRRLCASELYVYLPLSLLLLDTASRRFLKCAATSLPPAATLGSRIRRGRLSSREFQPDNAFNPPSRLRPTPEVEPSVARLC